MEAGLVERHKAMVQMEMSKQRSGKRVWRLEGVFIGGSLYSMGFRMIGFE